MLVRGKNSVSQMGESVFLWRLRSPSHKNKLFCNLRDLWIEFSAFLEWHLLRLRTTVVLSDLLSRTYVGVETTDLSRAIYAPISKLIDSTNLVRLRFDVCPGLTFCLAVRSTRDANVDNNFRYARNESWYYITIKCYCYSMSTFQIILFATFI